MMRDMAAATGRDAAKYQQMADSAKAYIKENFLNEDGTFKTAILNTMQTCGRRSQSEDDRPPA